MFNNYPMRIDVDVRNEEELNERISAIKELSISGVSLEKFDLMITNFSNGEPGRRPGEYKTLAEWKTMYEKVNSGEDISEADIENFFKYLQSYHLMMIRGNGKGSFKSLNRENIRMEEGFKLEYIIYKTLEI